MERVGDPAVSPDGRQIVFTLSSLDLEGNRRRTDLWGVGTDGKYLRRLTSHEPGGNGLRRIADGWAARRDQVVPAGALEGRTQLGIGAVKAG